MNARVDGGKRGAVRFALGLLVVAVASEALALPMGPAAESATRAVSGLVKPGRAAAEPAAGASSAAAVRHDAVLAAVTAGGMPAMRVLTGPAAVEAAAKGDAVRTMMTRVVLSWAALPRVGSQLDEVFFNVVATGPSLSWERTGPGLASEDSSLDLPESIAPGMAAAARRPGLLGAAVAGPGVGGMGESASGGGGRRGRDEGKKAEPVLRSIRFGGRTVYIIRDESQADERPE